MKEISIFLHSLKCFFCLSVFWPLCWQVERLWIQNRAGGSSSVQFVLFLDRKAVRQRDTYMFGRESSRHREDWPKRLCRHWQCHRCPFNHGFARSLDGWIKPDASIRCGNDLRCINKCPNTADARDHAVAKHLSASASNEVDVDRWVFLLQPCFTGL